MSKGPVLRMRDISKQFSGIEVLSRVYLDLYEGEVHALIGENGAGKSTLIKIMAGIHMPNNGEIEYLGERVSWASASQAKEQGISVIHQEFNLFPNMTVAENILLGNMLPRHRVRPIIDWKKIHRQAQDLLTLTGIDLDPRAKVKDLSVAQQQMLEIARALLKKSKVLIMDEPTATLTDKEIDKLFDIINDLKNKGVAVVYISHRMEEIFKIADRFTVLRDGSLVDSKPINETSPEQLIQMMVGRELKNLYQDEKRELHEISSKEPVLEVKSLTDYKKRVHNINLQVYPGEVVGLSGLVGAGRTELVRSIFGAEKLLSGTILVDGKEVNVTSPIAGIKNRIGMVPESRKEQGLFLEMSVKENIVMAVLKSHKKSGFLKLKKMSNTANSYIRDLAIRVSSPEQKSLNLSGGNQQKVLIAKWLATRPKILLLDEPTRGVDVGAKKEIYKIIHHLAAEGIGVLMVSSELPEILGVCDRILVMHEGRIKANIMREDASQEKIMFYATGGTK